MTLPRQYLLPDLFARCPLPGGENNPHFARAATESYAWVCAYNVVAEHKHRFYHESGSEILSSKTYYYADYEHFRVICDFMNMLFVMDETSDDQTAKDARNTMYILPNVLHDPTWDDGSKLCALCRDFQRRLSIHTGQTCYRRLITLCIDYVEAVIAEAAVREKREVWNLDSYLQLRRANSGVFLCFGLFDYAWGIELPDEVHEHPVFMRMLVAACDMVCWSNDLYSYNMEQAMGHTSNNVMTVLMKQENLDLQSAADYVGEHFGTLMESFLADKAQLPSFGPETDEMVTKHILSMEAWIIGSLEWSFETIRYFGPSFQQVKKTRVVTLRDKKV